VRHLFDELDHHRITIDPATANTAAIACYARLGFRTVGTMRSYERRSNGTWADGLLMELLATDFTR
jgi:aminoglycoside 6'-N-acetyltransferase